MLLSAVTRSVARPAASVGGPAAAAVSAPPPAVAPGAPTPGRGALAVDDALRGVALLERLGEVTRVGHVNRGYEAASDALFRDAADTDGDDRVLDIYTGRVFGPVTGRQDGWEHKLSVEHTWPRSRGAHGIAEADLHHLQVADKALNGRRSSLEYGEVATSTWHGGSGSSGRTEMGTDADGVTVFQPPADVRGDLARGLMYFRTRYGTGSDVPPEGFALAAFDHELPTLLRWHAADPVTQVERDRNAAIEAFQGNRNPFVDHPEYVDRIGPAGFGSTATRQPSVL